MKKDFLEQSLLGTMLEHNYLILDSQLTLDMFFDQNHRALFAMMRELALENHPVDFFSLDARYKKDIQIGMPYITELIRFSNPEKFDGYVQLQRDIWREKKKKQILVQATESDWKIPQIIQQLDETQLNGDVHDTTVMQQLIDMYERPLIEQTIPGLIVPHIKDLAALIDGFRPGEVTILAARPSMGKTDVMNNLALYAGWNNHLPIIFSLEMSTPTLLDRFIATEGNYPRLKMRNPKQYFNEQQIKNWPLALERILKANLHIDDRSQLTIAQIRAQARRIIRQQEGCAPIIFIDYLQIIKSDNDQDFSAIATSKISRSLKQMAKELNCPVVCLSQLNRNVESRGNKRPMMSDLRDSGSIEQDADIIIFLYRDSYYKDEQTENLDLLELIIAKNRNGPTGTAYALYNRMTGHAKSRDAQ